LPLEFASAPWNVTGAGVCTRGNGGGGSRFCPAADELVAPADAPKIGAAFGDVAMFGGGTEETVHFFFRNAVVAAGGFHGANFLFVVPLFQRGIADSEDLCGVAGREKFGCRNGDAPGISGSLPANRKRARCEAEMSIRSRIAGSQDEWGDSQIHRQMCLRGEMHGERSGWPPLSPACVFYGK
jgi:hypothetical protein